MVGIRLEYPEASGLLKSFNGTNDGRNLRVEGLREIDSLTAGQQLSPDHLVAETDDKYTEYDITHNLDNVGHAVVVLHIVRDDERRGFRNGNKGQRYVLAVDDVEVKSERQDAILAFHISCIIGECLKFP